MKKNYLLFLLTVLLLSTGLSSCYWGRYEHYGHREGGYRGGYHHGGGHRY